MDDAANVVQPPLDHADALDFLLSLLVTEATPPAVGGPIAGAPPALPMPPETLPDGDRVTGESVEGTVRVLRKLTLWVHANFALLGLTGLDMFQIIFRTFGLVSGRALLCLRLRCRMNGTAPTVNPDIPTQVTVNNLKLCQRC